VRKALNLQKRRFPARAVTLQTEYAALCGGRLPDTGHFPADDVIVGRRGVPNTTFRDL
jgi:hypothetical protein